MVGRLKKVGQEGWYLEQGVPGTSSFGGAVPTGHLGPADTVDDRGHTPHGIRRADGISVLDSSLELPDVCLKTARVALETLGLAGSFGEVRNGLAGRFESLPLVVEMLREVMNPRNHPPRARRGSAWRAQR